MDSHCNSINTNNDHNNCNSNKNWLHLHKKIEIGKTRKLKNLMKKQRNTMTVTMDDTREIKIDNPLKIER